MACFLVDAPSAKAALEWGDHLTRSYCSRSGEQYLSSSVQEPTQAENSGLPVVAYGQHVSDQEIGW